MTIATRPPAGPVRGRICPIPPDPPEILAVLENATAGGTRQPPARRSCATREAFGPQPDGRSKVGMAGASSSWLKFGTARAYTPTFRARSTRPEPDERTPDEVCCSCCRRYRRWPDYFPASPPATQRRARPSSRSARPATRSAPMRRTASARSSTDCRGARAARSRATTTPTPTRTRASPGTRRPSRNTSPIRRQRSPAPR